MDRSATDTLRGYFYQFHLTIIEILKAQDNDIITIEGIEDIDILSGASQIAIQCKYHEKTEYNHSVIKSSIQWMIRHYSGVLDNKTPLMKYRYFGHFQKGHEKLSLPISVEFLKQNFLTWTETLKKEEALGGGQKIIRKLHNELKLDDEKLQQFLSLLEVNIRAESFDNQYEELLTLFQSTSELGRPSLSESKDLFYNNALARVTELSVLSTLKERQITRKEFLEDINTKKHFFNKWFLALKNRKEYTRFIKKEHFSGHNRPPYKRFFLIETSTDRVVDIKRLILKIISKFSEHPIRGRKSYCPYIYLHNFSEINLKGLKTQLRKEGVTLIDGVDFKDADFCLNSLTKEVNTHNKIEVKFINEFNKIDSIIKKVDRSTREIYQFYINDLFYVHDYEDVDKVTIAIESIQDIEDMI